MHCGQYLARLILGLVWDYCVFSGQKGFCLMVTDILVVNSSSLVRMTLIVEKKAEDMVVLSV